MLPILGVLLLLYCVWREGNPYGIALLAAGVMLQVMLALRFARATRGGVGGHAEWVRDVSQRPRLERNPGWLLGSALVAIGAAIALFTR
ncbi:MAG TPA: hypothetical protein VIS07_03765 [Candidatus Binatia bacterium]